MGIKESDLNGKPFSTHCASDFGNFPRECLQFPEETPLAREAVEKDPLGDALSAKHERRRQGQDALLESSRLWDFKGKNGLVTALILSR